MALPDPCLLIIIWLNKSRGSEVEFEIASLFVVKSEFGDLTAEAEGATNATNAQALIPTLVDAYFCNNSVDLAARKKRVSNSFNWQDALPCCQSERT